MAPAIGTRITHEGLTPSRSLDYRFVRGRMNQMTAAAIPKNGKANLRRFIRIAPMTIAMRRPRVSAVHAAGRVAVGKQSHRAPNTMPMRMAAADQTVSVVDVANPTAATHRQINAVQPTRRRRSISDGAALVIRVAVCKRIGVVDRRDMHSFQSSSPGTHCTGGSWGLAVHSLDHDLNPNHTSLVD